MMGLVAATWLAFAPAAESPPPSPRSHAGRPYHLDLEVQTNVPIDVGARITAEFPYRL